MTMRRIPLLKGELEMELCVKRTDFSEQSTIGEMSVDGKFER